MTSGLEDVRVQSKKALLSFRDRVRQLGLWSGAWIGLVAICGEGDWFLYVLRVHLTAPGASPPGDVDDVTAKNIIVRGATIALADLWPMLAEVIAGGCAGVTQLAGVPLALPVGQQLNLWSATTNAFRLGGERSSISMSTSINVHFHDVFGFELFDRLAAQLRGHSPPYTSLQQVTKAMGVSRGGFDNNNASPVFEITAELPLGPMHARYNVAHKGLELSFEVGRDVPLERISVAVTPRPRRSFRGTQFTSTPRGDVLELFLLDPCEPSKEPVTVDLTYADAAVSTDVVHPIEGYGVFSSVPDEEALADAEWERELKAEYHYTLTMLRDELRAALPKPVDNLAEARIRESLLLRSAHPFFSVLSAASVAELLVKEQLAMVGVRRRKKAWKEASALYPRMRWGKKLPPDDVLKFDHAIKLATHLELLDDLDASSINLLRIARNEIHLNRQSKPLEAEFSPASAGAALLTTLKLCRRVAEQGRKRTLARRVRTSAAAPVP